ncbi:hypothetical protein J6590_053335 [Homalodisca vitripennis]|nr:hypothetical protein J6590_053335 [Homalodisca vitripennis]
MSEANNNEVVMELKQAIYRNKYNKWNELREDMLGTGAPSRNAARSSVSIFRITVNILLPTVLVRDYETLQSNSKGTNMGERSKTKALSLSENVTCQFLPKCLDTGRPLGSSSHFKRSNLRKKAGFLEYSL